MRLPVKNSHKRQKSRDPNIGAPARAITGAVGPYAFSTIPSGGTYAPTVTVTTHAESNDLETQRLDAIAALERYIVSRKGQIWTQADADEVKRLTRLVRAIMASQLSAKANAL